MATKRSPRRGKGAAPATPLLHNLSVQDKDSLTLTKARDESTDLWVEARINYLADELSRLDGGPISRLFLGKAKTRYRLYCRRGWPRDRYLCWSYLDQVASQLCGRKARSSKQEAT